MASPPPPPRPLVWSPAWWALVMLPPLLLSMGATITLLGVDIPMPFRTLHAFTNGMFRMPWRLGPIFIAAAVIFAALTFTPLLRNRLRWHLAAVVGVFLFMTADVRLYEHPPISREFRPSPLTAIEPPLPPYDFYARIGAERGPAYDQRVVLEVPTGAATGEVILGDPRAPQLQWYGLIHHKRMLNGFISRAPIDSFWRIHTQDPLLSWLGQRRDLQPELVEPELRQIIDDWPLGYIVVHQDLIGRATPTPQEIIGYFNSLDALLCPVWIERDAVVYRARAHPDACPARTPPQAAPGVYTLDLGGAGDERFIGWGWHWQESVADGAVWWRWAGARPQADLYIDLPPGDYRLTLTAQAFWSARMVTLRLNGEPLAILPSPANGQQAQAARVETGGLQTLAYALPADKVGAGRHLRLTLGYDAALVPREVGQSADPRPLAVAVDTITFERQ